MSEARLARAMASLGAPASDADFVFNAMATAEVARYRRHMAVSLLRGAGLAATAAALALPVLGWLAENAEAAQDALLAAALLGVMVSAMRRFRLSLAGLAR